MVIVAPTRFLPFNFTMGEVPAVMLCGMTSVT